MNMQLTRFSGANFAPAIVPAPFTAPVYEQRYAPAPVRAQAPRIGQADSAVPKTLAIGMITLGTAAAGTIAYFGIQAGFKEKGFLKVLGWLFGVPAAISTLGGLAALVTVIAMPSKSEPAGPSAPTTVAV